MLTILTALASPRTQTEAETIDRDPGIVALLAAMIRSARRAIGSAVAALPFGYQRANGTEAFGAGNARPDTLRS